MAVDYVHYFELIGITFQNSSGSKEAIPSLAPPLPLSPNSFIFMQFLAKILQNNRLAHLPRELTSSHWEILDPPLKNELQSQNEYIVLCDGVCWKVFISDCIVTHGLIQKGTKQPISDQNDHLKSQSRDHVTLRLFKRFIIWSDFHFKMSTIVDYYEAVDSTGPEGGRNTMHQIFVTSERISISDFGPFVHNNLPWKQLLFVEGALIRNLQCQCLLIVNQLSSKSWKLGHHQDLHHVWYYQFLSADK